MTLKVSRFDLLIAAMLGALVAFLSANFSPAARTIETQRALAIILPPPNAVPRDPDAGAMNAEPDRNNWDPADGQSHYGDGGSPDDDEDGDTDSSYDPPEPADTTPI